MEEDNNNAQLVKGPEKLTELLTRFSQQKDLNNITEISVYAGQVAEEIAIKSEIRRLTAAFPDIKSDFIIVLVERFIENKFTKERVKDSISSIIDNCPYKKPSISEIISFDKKVKVFTYSEVSQKCYPGYSAFDHFEKIEIDGRKRYIEK